MPTDRLRSLHSGATWIFFTGTIYLVLAAAAKPWLPLPDLGDYGFVFVCFAFTLLHCWALEGGRRTALFFSISAVVSYTMEEIGVRTGLIYGAYHYSSKLGARLGDVPIVIPLAWFMLIYPSWIVARVLLRGIRLHSIAGRAALALVAAWVMTAWDTVMDPGMSANGSWVWERGGAYFGVPRHNYLGWLLTTFLVYWLAGWLWREPVEPNARAAVGNRFFNSLPVFVYAAIALRYIVDIPTPALQVVALFSMGTPSLLAALRLTLDKSRPGD